MPFLRCVFFHRLLGEALRLRPTPSDAAAEAALPASDALRTAQASLRHSLNHCFRLLSSQNVGSSGSVSSPNPQLRIIVRSWTTKVMHSNDRLLT